MKCIERPVPIEIEQPWGIETLLCATEQYTLKRLFYRAGTAGGFQYHIRKTESFYLASGSALVRSENGGGAYGVVQMVPGQTYHIPAGAPHQFEAITDCVVFEASTPGMNDRVNVAERYGLPVEPGTLPTTYTPEEIKAFERGLIE